MGRNDEIPGAVTGGVTRRHFLEMSGGLLLAPHAVAAATATAVAPSTSPAGPAGSVRFLTAENFWADWSPYASTALSQLRLERQVYDYLVDFPSGDLAKPEPMLATAWRADRRSHVGVRAARRRDVPRRRAVHGRRCQGVGGVGHRVQRRERLRDQLGARRGRGRRPAHGAAAAPSSRSDRCLLPSAGTRRSCPQHGWAETPISWRPSRTAPARSASSRTRSRSRRWRRTSTTGGIQPRSGRWSGSSSRIRRPASTPCSTGRRKRSTGCRPSTCPSSKRRMTSNWSRSPGSRASTCSSGPADFPCGTRTPTSARR